MVYTMDSKPIALRLESSSLSSGTKTHDPALRGRVFLFLELPYQIEAWLERVVSWFP